MRRVCRKVERALLETLHMCNDKRKAPRAHHSLRDLPSSEHQPGNREPDRLFVFDQKGIPLSI